MSIPISFKANRQRAEEILMDAAMRHALDINAMAPQTKTDLQQRFGVEPIDLDPTVYLRITDNWIELTVRFIVPTHRIRAVKDAMSRFIVQELDKADIGIASATYNIVGFPLIEIRSKGTAAEAPNLNQA